MGRRFGGRDVPGQDVSVRRESTRWTVWLSFWTVLGLAFAAQVFLAGQRLGQPSDTWGQAIRISLPDWYVWGLFALLVARLKQRVPIDAISWGYNFAFHVAASLLVALAHLAISVPLQTLLQVVVGEPRHMSTYFVNNFATLYLWNVVVYWSILAGVHARDYRRDLREHRRRAVELEARLRELHAAAAVAEEPAARRHPERLLVAEDGRSFFVRTADVDWIETARNYVRLHAGDRVHTVRTTLAALEARMDPERFRRISRSALVNLDRVREVQPWFHGDAIVILESGARVTLSRRYRRNLLAPARLEPTRRLPDCRMTLFATKPIATLRAEAEATGEHALTRALGPLNLVTLGIGAVIGAGIFVITGQVAALYAGPAVPLSMILVGVACAFAGLCYAEMASAVPVAGSAYTYSYAT